MKHSINAVIHDPDMSRHLANIPAIDCSWRLWHLHQRHNSLMRAWLNLYNSWLICHKSIFLHRKKSSNTVGLLLHFFSCSWKKTELFKTERRWFRPPYLFILRLADSKLYYFIPNAFPSLYDIALLVHQLLFPFGMSLFSVLAPCLVWTAFSKIGLADFLGFCQYGDDKPTVMTSRMPVNKITSTALLNQMKYQEE